MTRLQPLTLHVLTHCAPCGLSEGWLQKSVTSWFPSCQETGPTSTVATVPYHTVGRVVRKLKREITYPQPGLNPERHVTGHLRVRSGARTPETMSSGSSTAPATLSVDGSSSVDTAIGGDLASGLQSVVGAGSDLAMAGDLLLPADADSYAAADSAEEKRLKRMRRNRESAAQSRNRKKQYVEELESQVRALESQVGVLHRENIDLRREHSRLTGQSYPELRAPPLPGFSPLGLGSNFNPEGADASAHLASSNAAESMGSTPSMATPALAGRKPSATDALLGLELLSRSASHAGNTEGIVTDASASASAAHAAASAADTPPSAPELDPASLIIEPPS